MAGWQGNGRTAALGDEGDGKAVAHVLLQSIDILPRLLERATLL